MPQFLAGGGITAPGQVPQPQDMAGGGLEAVPAPEMSCLPTERSCPWREMGLAETAQREWLG